MPTSYQTLTRSEVFLGVEEGGDVVVVIGGSSGLVLDLRATAAAAGEERALRVDQVSPSVETATSTGGGFRGILR